MSPAFFFGSFLAMYYFVGRWTFARLDGDHTLTPMVEQPRLWLVAILIFMAVAIQTNLSRAVRQFRPAGVDVATVAFLGYTLLSSIWGPDSELASVKAFEVSLLLVVAAVIAVNRNCGTDDQLHLGFWTTIVAIGMALGGLALLHGSDSRAYAPGGGPNTFGRNMGLTAFGAVYLASRYGTLVRVGSVGMFATAVMLVVRSGSRGGLLSFSVAAATYTVCAKMSVAKKSLIVAAVGVATSVALFYTDSGQQAVEVFSGRILQQTVQHRHLSGRDDLWLDALEMLEERPIFGWGLDGFRANSWNYPHNIFLEVGVEGGAVGVLLMLNIARAWWRQVRRSRVAISRAYLAALSLTFIAAQTSGDLFDSRGVFLMVALSLPAASSAARKPVPAPRQRPLPVGGLKPIKTDACRVPTFAPNSQTS